MQRRTPRKTKSSDENSENISELCAEGKFRLCQERKSMQRKSGSRDHGLQSRPTRSRKNSSQVCNGRTFVTKGGPPMAIVVRRTTDYKVCPTRSQKISSPVCHGGTSAPDVCGNGRSAQRLCNQRSPRLQKLFDEKCDKYFSKLWSGANRSLQLPPATTLQPEAAKRSGTSRKR